MKNTNLTLLFVFILSFTIAQDSIPEKKKNRYGIWLIPSWAHNIYGVAIGPFGMEAACGVDYTKRSHGLNIQIPGQGFIQLAYMKSPLLNVEPDSIEYNIKKSWKKAIHNGLIVSPFGAFTDQVNGVSISGFMSMGEKINGLSFNLFWNRYYHVNGVSIGLVNSSVLTKGVQIGLINRTRRLKGLQIGLWNVNDKRKLPFINW